MYGYLVKSIIFTLWFLGNILFSYRRGQGVLCKGVESMVLNFKIVKIFKVFFAKLAMV